VGRIPSHIGIGYNESADPAAKSALEKGTLLSQGTVSLPACKQLVIKHVNHRWQQRWSNGRVMHSLIPQVGRKSLLPWDRCVAV